MGENIDKQAENLLQFGAFKNQCFTILYSKTFQSIEHSINRYYETQEHKIEEFGIDFNELLVDELSNILDISKPELLNILYIKDSILYGNNTYLVQEMYDIISLNHLHNILFAINHITINSPFSILENTIIKE